MARAKADAEAEAGARPRPSSARRRLEAKRVADAEAARLADVARQNKAAERRDRMDEVKAKIKSASRKGRAVGLPAMLGVNLNFGPDDEGGEQGPSDTPAAATPSEPSTGYVPDGLTKEQYAAIKAKEQKSTNLGAWGSKVGGASGPAAGRPHVAADDLDGPGQVLPGRSEAHVHAGAVRRVAAEHLRVGREQLRAVAVEAD